MRISSLLLLLFAFMSAAPALAGGGKGDCNGKDCEEHGGPGGNYPDWDGFYRLDCRYHNIERNPGVNFCYASAVYKYVPNEDKGMRQDEGGGRFLNVHLGVGCDNTTLYNDRGIITVETTLDRLSPSSSATPGVEVFPQGHLIIDGTYTSELDIAYGRFQGLCYVHRILPDEPLF